MLVALARLLSPADFGIVTAAQVVLGFSLIFSQLGLAPALVQRPTLEPRHLETAFTASAGFGLLLGALLWLGAPAVEAFFRIAGVAPVLRTLAWVFPLQGFSAVAESQMLRELKFRWLATAELVTFVAGYGLVSVSLAALGAGAWALVAGQIAQTGLYTSALLLARRPERWPRFEGRAFGELFYFGGGLTVSKVANYLALQADNLVVGRWLGAAALGIYGRAYELMAGVPQLLGDAVDRVLFPAMASVQLERRRLATAYRRGVALLGLAALPASAVLLVTAPEMVRVLLGPQWSGVVAPFQILALGVFLRASYRISDVTARATGAVYRRAWRQLAYAACVAGGAWLGQHWGVAGVALGVLLALTVNFLLMAQLGLRLLGLPWRSFWRAQRPALMLGAACGAVAWGVATLAREHSLAPAALVAGTLGTTLAAAILLAALAPSLFLGADGRWMLELLRARLPGRAAGATNPAPGERPGPAEETLPLPLPRPLPLPLVVTLATALRSAGIRYCQWKGHWKRQRWGEGRGDIDLLVDRGHADRLSAVLTSLGFKLALPPAHARIPGVVSFYGLDPSSRVLVHVHVHFRPVIGGPWQVAYHLPIERAVLDSAQDDAVFRIPAPELEFVVFVLRMVHRMTVRDALSGAAPTWLAGVQGELAYLEARADRARVRAVLALYLPSIDAAWFAAGRAALQLGASRWQLLRRRLELDRRLAAYARRPTVATLLERLARGLARRAGARANGVEPGTHRFASGGAVIALVGGDGAGKSTCTAELGTWLSGEFATRTAHLGRPPRSLTTLAVGGVLKAGRALAWLVGQRRGPSGEGDGDDVEATGRLGYWRLARFVCTARDRYRLFRKVRRFAARGGIALCERYPIPETAAHVGPCIAGLKAGVPVGRLAALLRSAEERYYRLIAPPDVVIVLRVDPETAARRKTTEPADYVRARSRVVWETDWSATGARVVDADRPLADVLSELKSLVWAAL